MIAATEVFLFTPDYKGVALIHKRRGPDYIRGKWNGIGGKIEENEFPAVGAIREVREETGLELERVDYRMTLRIDGWCIYFYTAVVADPTQVRTTTDEPVRWFRVDELRDVDNLVDNLRWIIPFMLDEYRPRADVIVI